MGGVCCKDGIDDKEQTNGGPGPAEGSASAPEPASGKVAVAPPAAAPGTMKDILQPTKAEIIAKEVLAAPISTPATGAAGASAAASSLDPAKIIQLDHTQQMTSKNDTMGVPQTSSAVTVNNGIAASSAHPQAAAARAVIPATPEESASASQQPSAASQAPLNKPAPQPAPLLQPQPPHSPQPPHPQPPAPAQPEPAGAFQQQVPLPNVKPQVLADTMQTAKPSLWPSASALDPSAMGSTSTEPPASDLAVPPQESIAQAGLSLVGRSPLRNDLHQQQPGLAGGDEEAVKVKVETTRRSTHPTIGGGGNNGDGSSSVSYSHSATSSQQQPGSSVPPCGGGMPVPGEGSSAMIGSSAAQPPSIAGEVVAAATGTTPSGGNRFPGGAESIDGSSNPVSEPSNAGSTPATGKSATSGFMFGAPRVREHDEKLKKGAKRSKSQSSGSNASAAQPPAGSEGVTGSKASGSDAAAGGRLPPSVGSSGAAGTMIGSSAADQSMGSSDIMISASTPANVAGPGGAGCAAGSSSVGGPQGNYFGGGGRAAAGGSSSSACVTDYSSIGRRISRPKQHKLSSAGGGKGGSSAERPSGSEKTRSDPSSVAASSSAAGAAGGDGVGGIADGVARALASAGGMPEAVPEEGEEEEEEEDEQGGSKGSRRSSSEHLSIMSPPEGSDVENVLMLICNIFQLPVSLVAAYRSANIFIRSTALRLTDDDQWRYSLAQWSMLNAYELRDVLMVPNAAHDDRFCSHYCVKNEPKIKFFMASPLRSSTGELLGTLCMADFTERLLEPANLLVVNNLQTLVIRQLERDMALAAERAENEAATAQLQQEMMRALDHFEKCIMFVDTSKPGWEVLYTNLAWEHVTGIPREHVLGHAFPDGGMPLDFTRVPRVHVIGRPLQDFFMALGGASLDWSSTADELATRSEFTVNRVAVRQKPDKLVSLHLRLATDEANGELEGLLPKGLPGWVKARGSEMHNYFVFVEEVNPQVGTGSTVYEALAKHVEKVPGLELSHLLGKGGFGSVYYGTWNGMPVAVKMIDNRLTKTNTEGVSLEALMGQELSHPNIVKTIKYVMRNMLIASSMSGSNSRGVGPSSAARSGMPPGIHSRNRGISGGIGTPRHGSRNVMLPALGSPGGASSAGGGGISGPPTTGMMSYMTSAQPGLTGMTSAQMAAAADLTSASAMQHYNRMGTTMTSDATTVAGGGSGYSVQPPVGAADGSGGGTPLQESSLTAVAGISRGGGSFVPGATATSATTTSGQTAVGPASVAASEASTAAGPPSIASAGGVLANDPTGFASPAVSSRVPSVAAGSAEHAVGGGGGVPRFRASGTVPLPPPAAALPAQLPPLAAAAGDAASITAAYPPGAQPPDLAEQLTAEQQQAGMTSRFSLAFSTITSGGDVLVPGKGSRSPSISTTGGHTQPMGSVASGEDTGEVWIIMEFCDRGSLQDALDRGALKLRKPGGELGETHLPMMVATACEVASALHYLHDKGIVHGDLTAWNVMLCTAQTDRSGRNFVAKVADFGLSRTLDVKSKIKTRTYGTISHMPPECLINGIISKATDVFAFGVLLWQMYTGLRPWAGMNHGQIIYNVGMKNVQLLFPPGTPPAIADLSSSCTRTNPDHRPSFEDILEKLDNIRASLGL